MISDRRAAAQRRAFDHGSIADRDIVSDDDLGAAAAQDRRVVARDEVLADGALTARQSVDCHPLARMADRADVDRPAHVGADRVAPAQLMGDLPGTLVEDHCAGDPGREVVKGHCDQPLVR